MFKTLKRLFKPCVTLRFYDEGNKVIIHHSLKTINALTSTNAEIEAFKFLQSKRFDDSVEIRS